MFFLELSYYFYDPADVGNLISGSSAFSKSSLNIWNFMVHVLLKPSLKDFEQYLASVWNECKCTVVGTSLTITFIWDWNENWLFQSCGHCCGFQICWHIESNILIASYFRIWNSSAGILSPPLALLKDYLQQLHLLVHHIRLSKKKKNYKACQKAKKCKLER